MGRHQPVRPPPPQVLWAATKDHVGFCLGSRQQAVLRVVGESFQWPLPLGPLGDAFCNNHTRIDLALCGPLEIQQYYKVRPPAGEAGLPDKSYQLPANSLAAPGQWRPVGQWTPLPPTRPRHSRQLASPPPCSTCYSPKTLRRSPTA
jgi:hypothetical protein